MTNKERVLNHLSFGWVLTEYEGFRKFNMTSMAQVIKSLRNEGYTIISTWKTSQLGKRYVEYKLKKELYDKKGQLCLF